MASACVESALSEERGQGFGVHRNVKCFKHWRWWTEWGMFVWLEKVCEVCPHNKQLESSWDEFLCLCPAVWCSFVLVAAGIEVPSSRTTCSSAVSGCTAGGIYTWFWLWWAAMLLCKLGTERGSFRFMWAFTVEAWGETWNKRPEHLTLDRDPGIRAPCMVSPVFSTF